MCIQVCDNNCNLWIVNNDEFIFFFSESFFDFFKVDEQVTLSALIYGDILLGGIIFIWLFNVTISVTRGSGNTIIPAIGWTIVLLTHILAAAINFKFDSGIFI